MSHTAKQIAAIVLETLERNVLIARQNGNTIGGAISLEDLAALHRACANNLGQVLAEAFNVEAQP